MENFRFASAQKTFFAACLAVLTLVLSQKVSSQNNAIAHWVKRSSYSRTATSQANLSDNVVFSDTNAATAKPSNSNDRNGKAVNALLKRLVDDGRIKLNEKTKFFFDNSQLSINGKSMDEATFKAYKKYFEDKLEDGKITYEIKFKGMLTTVSEAHANVAGSFSVSFTKQD